MSKQPLESARGYSAEAPELLKRYEEMGFEGAHFHVAHLIPPGPLDVLDVGAGTGRDAAWFAARGDRVTAIEPTRELREGAMALHPDPNIEWIDDALPGLDTVFGRTFDLVWMSAVWMHFDAAERARMMPGVAALVRQGGSLMVSLRHGLVPEGRRMFEVSADETIALTNSAGLALVSAEDCPSPYAEGVMWSRLWFRKPVR